ncbi:MAG: glycosyltransferase family 2 protein [Gammaproteobacteria bacterium]|nr:glycosyltransferase family 2 protein [Gammaproteobacteria bacterium]NNC97521.1 glycosyltransferase family 2 protein [Gammaproteobacteria bacterium]NNM14237.1 glycosyltransferase family 2 protein [Gammaproteobacteria bacterium]
MQLSIIIVNYKSWMHLSKLLEGLINCPELSNNQWEILVVDNASGDGNLDKFQQQYPMVQFIDNGGNHGFAHANNVGVEHSRGEYLLFMNPDVVASPDAVRQLFDEKIRHPEIALLTALQIDSKGRLQKSYDRFPDLITYFRTVRNLMRRLAPKKNPDPRQRHIGILDVDWISGSLILMSRKNFDRIGGWNEDYWMYAEDMDLSKRAANLGLRRAISANAEFIHTHGGASRINPEVTLITKSEVMRSAHVYVHNHFAGLHKTVNHIILVLRNMFPLMLAGILNILTLGQSKKINLRAKLFTSMFSYYLSVVKNGHWLSDRSVKFKTRA